MVNNTLTASPSSTPIRSTGAEAQGNLETSSREKSLSLRRSIPLLLGEIKQSLVSKFALHWQMFAIATFLVSVPVFIEAPLVRILPWLSLALTGFWLWLSHRLLKNPKTTSWGDLLFGFSWSWLAGSIYWGWLRWEPLWHLPIESIALPLTVWCLWQKKYLVGSWFYLGSLLGTVLTDVYFYVVNLIPFWRQIMVSEADQAPLILHAALGQLDSPWGVTWAVGLVWILMFTGLTALTERERHTYAFAGAVLSTILVDALFLIAAIVA